MWRREQGDHLILGLALFPRLAEEGVADDGLHHHVKVILR
jgi:hypothetical protein